MLSLRTARLTHGRTRRSRAAVVGLALAVALGATACSSAQTDSHTATVPRSISLEGYGVASPATLSALSDDDSGVDIVGISGVSITSEGQGVAASSDEALKIAAKAKKAGMKSELLVDNIDSAQGDFSADRATKMLSSEENRQFVIAGLASEVAHGGYDGIQLDLESLSASNADDLVSFAEELRSTLPSSATISMALMPSTTTAGYAAAGYDLAALRKSIGRFVLMAYDEHGTGFSAAGPVGGLPWTKQAVSALTSLVPAKKVDLGVAGYGYSWQAGASAGKGGGVLTTAAARTKAGSRANWVVAQGEWTAKLADGTVLWWSDARSLTVRSNYAASIGLHGVALWQVTTGDPVTRGD